MPRYEFYCDDCKKSFELILTFAEYEKGKIKCPKCGKEHVHQVCSLLHRDLKEKLRLD
jgi:putative FmdB family regulatory protein